MNRPDHWNLAQFLNDIRMPAVLYFPPEVLGQLNEICELREMTSAQLISEAIQSFF